MHKACSTRRFCLGVPLLVSLGLPREIDQWIAGQKIDNGPDFSGGLSILTRRTLNAVGNHHFQQKVASAKSPRPRTSGLPRIAGHVCCTI